MIKDDLTLSVRPSNRQERPEFNAGLWEADRRLIASRKEIIGHALWPTETVGTAYPGAILSSR